ncbi:MAG: hypothetical protein KGJ78_07010 [Alphaproteobacteria bacterium]|nr:hypothetical protein [Alphaproteobacteria bacterium]
MSDDNRFFRFIWRFNALALAVVALAGAVAAGHGLWSQFHRDYGTWWWPQGNFAPVPKAAEKDFTYRLEADDYSIGDVTLQGAGRHERLVPLKRWAGPPKVYGLQDQVRIAGDKQGVGAVNLLIIDGDTGASRWMFRGYQHLIVTEEALYATEPQAPIFSGAQMPPVTGLLLSVVDKDTNGDGQLDGNDRVSLYAYRAGGQPILLLTADTILTLHQIGSDRLLIVFENGRSATAATFSTADFKLISQAPLPNVPQ